MNNFWSSVFIPMMPQFCQIGQFSQNSTSTQQSWVYLPRPVFHCRKAESQQRVQDFNSKIIQDPKSNQKLQKKIQKPAPYYSKQKIKNKFDDEYRQREQKSDRNIPSSAIKLFLKYIKTEENLIILKIQTIINFYGLQTSANQFLEALKQQLPLSKTYYRPTHFLRLCTGKIIISKCPNFDKILRILFRHFIKDNVYRLCSRKYQCNRKMLFVHIQAGRALLESIEKRQNSFTIKY